MLSNESRVWRVVGIWSAVVTLVIACSVAADASFSSTVLLLVLCAAPPGVALLLGFSAPPPTVAELLYAVHTENDRQ